MTDIYEHSARPGSAGLSILSFVGLGAFTAFLWQVSPGSVMLVMIPALLMCLWQLTRTPTYGIKMTKTAWHVLTGGDDYIIPTNQIAHVRLSDVGAARRVGLMLNDGTEVVLPIQGLPDPTVLIREATDRGIPVRDLTNRV